ncbi:MAG: DUF420 domain-containing protein [Vicinamibacterales bacterium]|nr:DUF420 domain-containing protein [Vicinamibacterales bacterium]
MTISDLPALNATLNGIATVLLLAGWWLIKSGRREAHRTAMVAALATSVAFLTSYVIYHAHAGSKAYTGTGPIRLVYFAILISHIILAAAIVPMVLMTVARAFKGDFDRHRNLARWTLPLWLYVSVTGVVIYLMLY